MILHPSDADVKEDYQRYVSRAMTLIHAPETTQQIQGMLRGSDPVRKVAAVTVMIMQRLDAAARTSGIEVQDTVKVYAAAEIVSLVNELGEAAKMMQKFSPKLHELALAAAVQDYVRSEVKAGRINPQKLQQQLNEGLRNLPPKERQEIEAAQVRIQQTARQYNGGKGRVA